MGKGKGVSPDSFHPQPPSTVREECILRTGVLLNGTHHVCLNKKAGISPPHSSHRKPLPFSF